MKPSDISQHLSKQTERLLSEAEARRIGNAATRIAQLRDALKLCTGGSLTITTRNGAQSIALYQLDVQALLDLLIEREGQFLTSFGVQLEKSE